MKHDVKQLLTLASFGKIGPRGFQKLVDTYGTIDHLTVKKLVDAGVKLEVAEAYVAFEKKFDVHAELEKLDHFDVRLVVRDDREYPPLLKEIYDPPYLLFVQGSLEGFQRPSLAVVGSRKHTHYANYIIDHMVSEVAPAITIVSGLARGVDGLAHQAALKAPSATIAIVGCGQDIIYPPEHRGLAEKIVAQGGAIISEYPLGTAPLPQHFPARNRILAGATDATLVVECDIKSGAMITAHHALEQDRQVLAVPGPISSFSSSGPNALLRLGAHVVTSATDVLELFNMPVRHSPLSFADTALPEQEALVLALIQNEPVHIDRLVEQSTLNMAEINSALLFLELKGMVRNVGAANYVRR